jgi:hypothetical protein
VVTELDAITTRNYLVDVTSGEQLEPTPVNAARCRHSIRDMRDRLTDLAGLCDDILADESRRQGTKTLHLDDYDVVVTGGPTVEYDAQQLQAGLADAGCPADRIDALVTPVVEWKVNRSVLRQLAAANLAYKQAIDNAAVQIDRPYRASVK